MPVNFNPRLILWPFSLIYRLAVGIRNRMFDSGRLPSVSFYVPVISVGNLTAGGTGKTPHVEYLAARLSANNRVAVLSRGYGRKSSGFVLLGKKTSARVGGDEPVQIKNKYPYIKVAVDNGRVHGINKLLNCKNPPEVIILDDAFQHRHVKPAMSVLLVNYLRPVFSDFLLPAGNLREPAGNVSRADAVIVTKCPPGISDIRMQDFITRLKTPKGIPVFFTTYSYEDPVFVFRGKGEKVAKTTLSEMRRKEAGILMVTGIADPRPLKEYLSGITGVDDAITYGDHHTFTDADIKKITARYRGIAKDKKYIVCTEKDAMRLKGLKIKDKKIRKAICYIPVEVKFLAGGEEPFLEHLGNFLKYPTEGLSL